MDPRGNIYQSENVPPEDKARLEGFLKGRAEADREDHEALVREQLAALEALEEEKDRGAS